MLDGFALDDLNTVVIRALHSPQAVCVAPATEGQDRPDPWTVLMGSTASATGFLVTIGPAAWTGDVPLVPNGSVSDELAAWVRFGAVTPLSIVP